MLFQYTGEVFEVVAQEPWLPGNTLGPKVVPVCNMFEDST